MGLSRRSKGWKASCRWRSLSESCLRDVEVHQRLWTSCLDFVCGYFFAPERAVHAFDGDGASIREVVGVARQTQCDTKDEVGVL